MDSNTKRIVSNTSADVSTRCSNYRQGNDTKHKSNILYSVVYIMISLNCVLILRGMRGHVGE